MRIAGYLCLTFALTIVGCGSEPAKTSNRHLEATPIVSTAGVPGGGVSTPPNNLGSGGRSTSLGTVQTGGTGTAPVGPPMTAGATDKATAPVTTGGMAAMPTPAAGQGPTAGSGTAVPPVMTVATSKDPTIPPVNGDCPAFKEGTTTADFAGFKQAIWEVGPKSDGTGSLIFYWHGTGSSNSEYRQSMPAALIDDVKAKGGIIVSPQSGTGTGGDCSGTATFAMDDFKVADQIVACAVRDWGIDPHRIYSTGCSAGGLQAGCMAKQRSNYMAAVVPNSGGEVVAMPPADGTHIPAVMTMHGAPGQDVVIVDFNDTSKAIDDSIKRLGGFAVDCNHGGGHCAIPMPPVELYMAGWEFMQDHPFGYDKEPYGTMLPTTFPDYCKIW